MINIKNIEYERTSAIEQKFNFINSSRCGDLTSVRDFIKPNLCTDGEEIVVLGFLEPYEKKSRSFSYVPKFIISGTTSSDQIIGQNKVNGNPDMSLVVFYNAEEAPDNDVKNKISGGFVIEGNLDRWFTNIKTDNSERSFVKKFCNIHKIKDMNSVKFFAINKAYVDTIEEEK